MIKFHLIYEHLQVIGAISYIVHILLNSEYIVYKMLFTHEFRLKKNNKKKTELFKFNVVNYLYFKLSFTNKKTKKKTLP